MDQPNWELLGRYAAGEATPEEQELVRQWLAAHPEEAQLLDILSNAPAMAPPLVSEFETEAALRKVKARRGQSVEATSSNWRRPALAAAAVLSALGIYGVLQLRDRTIEPQTMATTSALDTLLLDDGTRVIVAPNSRITVAADYGQKHRTVRLDGQAHFTVVHDESLPFTVMTPSALVRDVGTAFDVQTEADTAVAVTVLEGIVDLKSLSDSIKGAVRLMAGDHGRVTRGRAVAERNHANTIDWTAGGLVFRNASMADVQRTVERWYGVKLQVHDASMRERHLTASFTNEPVDQVLHILALAVGGTVERRGNTAILHSTPLSEPPR